MAKNNEKAEFELILNGQKAFNTIKEVQSAMAQLRAVARNTSDPAVQQKSIEQWKNLNGRVQEFNSSFKTTGGLYSRLSNEIKGFGAAALGYLSITAGVAGLKKLFTANAELSDQI